MSGKKKKSEEIKTNLARSNQQRGSRVDNGVASEVALIQIVTAHGNTVDADDVVVLRLQRDPKQVASKVLLVVASKDNGSVSGANLGVEKDLKLGGGHNTLVDHDVKDGRHAVLSERLKSEPEDAVQRCLCEKGRHLVGLAKRDLGNNEGRVDLAVGTSHAHGILHQSTRARSSSVLNGKSRAIGHRRARLRRVVRVLSGATVAAATSLGNPFRENTGQKPHPKKERTAT